MARRWGDRTAFRAAPSAAPALRPSGRQSVALLAVLLLAAGAAAAASFFIRPDKARSFDVFHGSVFLEDSLAPVAVDLASGRPTVRLIDANKQVGAKSASDLAVAPLVDGTMLLNRRTGEFNLVDSTGFLIKRDGGVPLPKMAGAQGAVSAVAVPSGELSYIEQTSPTRTSIYLVSRSTLQTALASSKVRPRAFRAMSSPVSASPSASASADGDLWVLTGRGDQRTIRRLSVPANSKPGAMLTADDHGSVTGAAAIGTATDGSGSVVGVASDDQIRVFRRGSLVGTASFAAPAGVTAILPASNAQGRLSFLMRGSTGWSSVSVGADGSGLRGPSRLAFVAATADLVTPAASGGSLYTMDADGGQFVRIDSQGRAGPIPGADRYPLAQQNGKTIEPGGFGDAYSVARGHRVIFNSPAHREALVLFTDGSHGPLRIEKSAAVSVNAAGGADALTQSRLGKPTGKGKSKPTNTPRQATAPISNRINCQKATQNPHIPTITQATAGSRSVLLEWNYPLLDPQDCEPSTYRVSVRALTNGAPAPPTGVTVQGQKSVNLAGLSPSTRYEITVAAYINGQSTSSSPVQVSTGPSGPDAPTGVQASTNSSGAWSVTWASCGTRRSGCEPAASWRVVPQFCDGQGLSSAPSPIEVTADPTTTEQPAARLDGGTSLLGRGLQFQVEGIGDAGTVGTPSGSTACSYSWARPIPGDISVSASTPPSTSPDATTSTNAVVRYTSLGALGGVGAQLSYRLIDSSGSTVSSVAHTTDTSVQLGGISPGAQYRVAVTISPPRHPEAAVALPLVAVTPTIAAWPNPGASARASYDTTGLADGTLSVSFSFPGSTVTRGETFDLVNSSMDCGNTHLTLTRDNVSPGQTMVFTFDRILYYGDCTVTVQLSQNAGTATNPPLFGSTSSPATRPVPLTIAPPLSGTGAGDFQAQWSNDFANPQVQVTYQGSDPLQTLASGWSIVVSNGSSSCGSANSAPSVSIPIDRACISAGGTFTVSIDYRFLVTSQHFDGIRVDGDAPRPVDPDRITFNAAWVGSAGDPLVDISYTGSENTSSFSTIDWTEVVTSGGVDCSSTASATPGGSDILIPVDLSACPPANGSTYSVQITLRDPYYGASRDYLVQVTGTPPQ